jgi:hypothetical protein
MFPHAPRSDIGLEDATICRYHRFFGASPFASEAQVQEREIEMFRLVHGYGAARKLVTGLVYPGSERRWYSLMYAGCKSG